MGTRLPELASRLGPTPQATFGQKQKQTKGILEGRETPHLDTEVALLYLYFCPPLFFLNAVILGGVGSRKFGPAPLPRGSGAARSSSGPRLREPPEPSLPPCRCLLFPQDRAKVLLGRAEAARAALHAWHIRLALSWLLSNQGPAAAALTKAEARVPLSSLCFDPPPRFLLVSCRRPGAARRSRFTLGLASS